MKCVRCGANLFEGDSFCRQCGEHIKKNNDFMICRNCGAKISAASKYCSNCGVNLINNGMVEKTAIVSGKIPVYDDTEDKRIKLDFSCRQAPPTETAKSYIHTSFVLKKKIFAWFYIIGLIIAAFLLFISIITSNKTVYTVFTVVIIGVVITFLFRDHFSKKLYPYLIVVIVLSLISMFVWSITIGKTTEQSDNACVTNEPETTRE